ncbi:MAG: hypothetical protein O2867_04195 [Bacteroidetes bacterium]|jgi:hypothetical protein|nr:hypothetical protein [Bacteroidota bacterium]
MKTNIIIATVISLFIGSTSYASNGIGGGKDEIKQQVLKKLHQVEVGEQGVVNAKFVVNDIGELELESVESDSQSLKNFVHDSLDGLVLKLKDQVKEGERSYNLNILFKKEK